MVLKIISIICVILMSLAAGGFTAFVIFKLKKIDSQTDSIPKHRWSMRVYMNDIPQNEQNILRLGSVPLKTYERNEYSELPVPRVGEEVGGIYCSDENRFDMNGTVTSVYYNVDMDLIVVECKCTEIHKI